jgi:nucleotide-binding universal stress UspA family protein
MLFEKILLAYNGTAEGRAALLASEKLAEFADRQIHLLAVASMPSSMFLTEGFVPEELIETEKARMQAVLDEGLATLHASGLSAAGHLAVGEPVEEMSRLARELGCDLIVVGHRQSGGWARWWQGAVSRNLVDHAPCSVLITITR